MGNYSSHKLGRKCSRCGSSISDANRSGLCCSCFCKYGRFGANNPFYGKTHSQSTKAKIVETCRKATEDPWKNPEYREKVIANATGLHRSEEFKRGQSVRTKASYDKIKGLRELRGKIFSQNWKDGRTHYIAKPSPVSKEEKELQQSIESSGIQVVRNETVRIGERKYISPDMLIDGKIIVEYYGDYYHGNPRVYEDDEKVCNGAMSAKEKREIDAVRIQMAKKSGYKVVIVWEKDYKDNKGKTTTRVINQIRRYQNEMV